MHLFHALVFSLCQFGGRGEYGALSTAAIRCAGVQGELGTAAAAIQCLPITSHNPHANFGSSFDLIFDSTCAEKSTFDLGETSIYILEMSNDCCKHSLATPSAWWCLSQCILYSMSLWGYVPSSHNFVTN